MKLGVDVLTLEMTHFSYCFNLLKLKLIQIMFKNSLSTKKTQRVSITTLSWLMLFKEIIAVYSESDKLCGQNTELLNVKACATYSYHCALKG
jgi:hypothetical protein